MNVTKQDFYDELYQYLNVKEGEVYTFNTRKLLTGKLSSIKSVKVLNKDESEGLVRVKDVDKGFIFETSQIHIQADPSILRNCYKKVMSASTDYKIPFISTIHWSFIANYYNDINPEVLAIDIEVEDKNWLLKVVDSNGIIRSVSFDWIHYLNLTFFDVLQLNRK